MRRVGDVLSAVECLAGEQKKCEECEYRHNSWGTCTGIREICKDAAHWMKQFAHDWNELKETIEEMRDNGGHGSQQEVCIFLANLMDVIGEKYE